MIKYVKNVPFYPSIAVLMLIVNIIGFAPSYFLKPIMDSPELPIITHIHGVIFTCWFILFLIQATLVKYRKIKLHQTLGKAGGFLALIMLFSGLQILYYRTLEFDGSRGSLENTALVLCGNLVLLLLFIFCTGLGIKYRRKATFHKRFMLLACISMMPQALGRIGKIPLDDLVTGMPNEVIFGLGGMLFFIGILWSHDLFRFGHLHRVSGLGGPFIMIMIILAAVLFPKMEFVMDFIIWLNETA